jgi:putative SOS response-associated peptidase YedK
MCGRFTQTRNAGAVGEHFHLGEAPAIEPRYNIAPTQPVIALRHAEQGGAERVFLRWC